MTTENKIRKGCWMETPYYDSCVCTNIEDNVVSFRYSAIPCENGKMNVLRNVWVEQVTTLENVRWVASPNAISMAVSKLHGPYGEDEPPIKNNEKKNIKP